MKHTNLLTCNITVREGN